MSSEKELMGFIGSADFDKVDNIKNLIEEGVDINYVFQKAEQVDNLWFSRTPLMECIITAGISQSEEDFEVFELLTENGADMKITDESGNTPALIAVRYFALDILRFLVQQGANIHDQNTAEENAFDIIIARYEEEREELGEEDVNDKGEAFERMLERIDAIVENGYDLSGGKYPATECALLNISENRLPAETLIYLFDKGADPRGYVNPEEGTPFPLLEAAFCNNLPDEELVAMIGKIGVEYVYEQYVESTPLLLAVHNQNEVVIKNLISSGADVHIQNDRALRVACDTGNLEIVKYLVGHGAIINATDLRGDNSVALAEKLGFTDIVAFLKSKL